MAGAIESADVASASPEFVDLPGGAAVARRAELHPSGIAHQCGTSYPLLHSHLEKSGAEPTGPFYCIYYSFSPEVTDMEVGIPFKLLSSDASVPADPENGIIVVTRLGGKAASMLHVGPYPKLGETYKAIGAWIRSQGKLPGSLMFEEYYNNPMVEKDPSKLKTRVYMSLSDGS